MHFWSGHKVSNPHVRVLWKVYDTVYPCTPPVCLHYREQSHHDLQYHQHHTKEERMYDMMSLELYNYIYHPFLFLFFRPEPQSVSSTVSMHFWI